MRASADAGIASTARVAATMVSLMVRMSREIRYNHLAVTLDHLRIHLDDRRGLPQSGMPTNTKRQCGRDVGAGPTEAEGAAPVSPSRSARFVAFGAAAVLLAESAS